MELSFSNLFIEIPFDELIDTQGGGDPWGVAAGAFSCVGGAGMVVSGVALWLVPEPSTVTKWAGSASIIVGLGAIGGGIAAIKQNL